MCGPLCEICMCTLAKTASIGLVLDWRAALVAVFEERECSELASACRMSPRPDARAQLRSRGRP